MRFAWLLAPCLVALAAAPGCSREAEERAKKCKDALDDTRRFVEGPDVQKTRDMHAVARQSCAPEQQAEVDRLGALIDKRAAQLEEAKAAAAALAARSAKPEEPLPGGADGSVKTTSSCKQYVDCVCELADAIRKGTGKDTYRARCDEAKKAVDGRRHGDPACQVMLGELTADEGWKSAWEARGVSIPLVCP
jgi:hypothetical protein